MDQNPNDPLTTPPPGTVATTPAVPTGTMPAGQGQPSKKDAAKGAAADTAHTAGDKGKEVAHTAADQAKGVAAEAKNQAGTVAGEAMNQARSVMSTAGSELQNQLGDRLGTASTSARDTAGQLRALAEGRTDEAGQVGDFARKAGDQLERLADRVDELGVQGVVEEVSDFARRRPVAFLAGAAVTGFVIGRMARAGKDAGQDDGRSGQYDTSYYGTSPALSTSPTVDLTSPEPYVTGTYDPTVSTTPGVTSGSSVPAGSGPSSVGGGTYGEVR